MALKILSTAVMVHVSDFARPGTPERAALERVPEARALIPLCEAALEKLLLAQPPSESTIAKITVDLAAEDVRHDDLVRGIYGRLDSEASLSVDPEVRQACFTARNALFPHGMAIINRSYTQEAGEAPLREKRVTPDVERTLKKLKTHDGATIWDHYQELQGRALTIGAQEKRRTGLEVEGTEQPRTVDARNGWIRAVNALANVLAAAEVDEAPILGGVRIAEQRAEASRGGGSPAPGGGSPAGPATPPPGGDTPTS